MRSTRFNHSLVIALLLALVAMQPAQASPPLLERDVLPILTKQCMGCHGGLVKKGGLDLRTVDAMLAGGDSGPAIVAGEPEKSELWLMIATDDMPQGEAKLSDAEKQTIRQWIASGLSTVAQRHAEKPAPPLDAGRKHEPAEVAGAIDRLVEAKLDAAGFSAAPVADDDEFLRRVYLHLTGRVPSAEQAAAFLESTAPDKRARLIDELLASPQFGEQLGRTWRDWVCPPELPSDMNGGKQPHQEARELGQWFAQRFAAGDPWDNIVRNLLTVKGEVKQHPQAIYFGLVGQDAKITAEGSARTVASLFMGVQLQCAQCHDDPYRDWSQREFWALAAFFGHVKGDLKKVEEKAGPGQITIPDSAFKNTGTTVFIAFF